MPTVSMLLSRTVATPQRTAVVSEHREVTYGELWQQVERCAAGLVAAGVGPGDVVAVLAERSPDLIAIVLACWRAGAVFLPIDVNYPQDRQRLILDDSRPAIVVQLGEASALPGAVPVSQLLAAEPGISPERSVGPDDPAYLIYTSGTTGRPKGVLVAHRGILNLAEVQSSVFEIGPDSTVLQFASPSFDAFISELVTTVWSGARLAVPRAEQLGSARDLRELVAQHRVTVATLPPSLLGLLSPADLPSLATVVAAGESCPAAVATRWGSAVRFINAYGPTECTVCATMGVWRPGDPLPPAIGSIIPGLEGFVVGDDLEPVAAGDEGELLLSGIGLALGYHDRPAETAAAFVDFRRARSGRAYRTGDRVRQRPDGAFEFRGRRDDQVKVAGYRIELDEVRNAIEAVPGVRQCELALRGSGAEAQLCAFVVLAGATVAAVVAACRAALPAYMVPTAIVEVGAIPLSPNGKVDRAALLALAGDGAPPVSTPGDDPIAAAWRDALGLTGDIDDTAEFWSVGGTSLRLLSLVERIERELGARISPRLLLARPITLTRMRELVEHRAPSDDSDAGFLFEGPGSALPMAFLFPPVTGDPYGLLELGRAVAATRRSLLLASAGFFSGTPASEVSEMARRYADQVAGAVPTGGPVLLIAYSVGAMHSFETARELVTRGYGVRLMMVDGAAPPGRKTPPPEAVLAFVMCRMLAATQGLDPIVTPAALGAMTEPERIAALRGQLIALGLATAATSDAVVRRRFNVFRANIESTTRYDCAPQAIDVVQIQSEAGHPFPSGTDPFDWRPFVLGRYELRVAPGNHFTVLSAANAPHVAEVIADAERAVFGQR